LKQTPFFEKVNRKRPIDEGDDESVNICIDTENTKKNPTIEDIWNEIESLEKRYFSN
jgi:hypothetical protein